MPRTKKQPPVDLEARVAALERALSIVLVHIPAAFFETQDAADGRTRRILDELEDRLAAGADLARVLLPEEAHDEAMAEYEALPADAKERSTITRHRVFGRLTFIGAV